MAFCPLDYRYGNQDFKHIWSESGRHERQLEVERALIWAHWQLGRVSEEDYNAVAAISNPEAVRKERVSEIEAEKAKGNVPQAAIDQNLRVTKPSRTYNPDYDPNRDYVPRSERKEWDAIGLMGKLVVRRGQPIGANWILMKSNVGTDPNDSNIILDKYLVR